MLSKHGVEIPLERINNINFDQRIFERMIGAGDLDIESAGREGQSHFEDVRHPDGVQQEIYRQMESQRQGDARSWSAPARDAGRWRRQHPRADRAARRPPRQGPHHRRGVRDQEGRAPRADVATALRVVSLVPSVTETLRAARRRPGGVHAVLRATRPARRRRDEEPGRRGDRRARARPRGRERRGEPHRGRRRARRRRAPRALDVAPLGGRRRPRRRRARRRGRCGRARALRAERVGTVARRAACGGTGCGTARRRCSSGAGRG